MILHASISAHNSQHVASVLAELWGGDVFPFPPVPDAWIAMAGDARGTGIEVYPNRSALKPGSGEEMFEVETLQAPPVHVANHLAIECLRPQSEIESLAKREGWRTVRCSRGGLFDVIEVWIENRTMIEVLTKEMTQDYIATSSVEDWRAAMDSVARGEVQ